MSRLAQPPGRDAAVASGARAELPRKLWARDSQGLVFFLTLGLGFRVGLGFRDLGA